MLYGEINRQRLKIINEHVVADTIDYLEARFAFSEDWDGLEKWVHFAKDGEVYDIRLTDNCVRKEDHLNLSAGIWKVYLHGNEFSGGKVIERITTNAAILKVEPTGTLDGEPFPEMPASVTEQILARLSEVEQNGGGSGGGYSPEAKVERVEGGVRVTITDKDGTTSEVVQDGKSGVHVGSDAPPEGTRVWVNPDGKRTKIPKVDESLTKAGYAADAAKVGEQLTDLSREIAKNNEAATNFETIAHQGYPVASVVNSLQSIIDADKEGFKWAEIDIRRCADGIYVLSHDASITLYDNGMPISVVVEETNYSDIAGFTWDAAGTYPICTVQSAFSELRSLRIKLVLDRKYDPKSSNADLMRMAARAGVARSVMLSYGWPGQMLSDIELLNRYKDTPCRVIPSDINNFAKCAENFGERLYANINAQTDAHYQEYLNFAMSYSIPIIFSGCTTNNVNIWGAIAAGCMASGNNFTPSMMAELINVDYSKYGKITHNIPDYLSEGSEATFAANIDVEGLAGNIYAYSHDPLVCSVKQTAFGNNISLVLNAVSAGNTEICLFTASGTKVVIPISTESDTLYVLPGETVFNGTDYYIDTGVQLFDTAKDFTIVMDCTMEAQAQDHWAAVHCMNENAVTGGLKFSYKGAYQKYCWQGGSDNLGNYVSKMPVGTRAKMVVVAVGGAVKLIRYKLEGDTIVAPEVATTEYVSIPQTLILGATRAYGGQIYRFWNGTIYDFKIYSRAFTVDEMDEYLNG